MAAPTTYTTVNMVAVYNDLVRPTIWQTVIGPNDGGTYLNGVTMANYSNGTLTIDISSIASSAMIALSGDSAPTTYSVAILYD